MSSPIKKDKASARDKFGKDQRLISAAWDERYRSRELAWDMGMATPPIARTAQSLNLLGKSVLVPGCGRGFEVQLLTKLGANVVGVDFSGLALAEARSLALRALGNKAGGIEWVGADVRKLPLAWTGRFDWVVEHTCFCAIAPKDRGVYLSEMHRVLKPSGQLLGLFFVDFEDPDGPPFGIFQHALRSLLEPYFVPVHWESHPADSCKSRKNQEALVLAQKRWPRALKKCSSRL